MPYPVPAIERFLDKIALSDTGCHEWQSTINKRTGYGQFWFRGDTWRVHQAAWEIFRGPIPDGLCVLHHCDNRRCVNPEHLYLGTHKDNARDMHERRRNVGRRVLSDSDVQKIREWLSKGYSQEAVSRMFGVKQMCISRVARGVQRFVREIPPAFNGMQSQVRVHLSTSRGCNHAAE